MVEEVPHENAIVAVCSSDESHFVHHVLGLWLSHSLLLCSIDLLQFTSHTILELLLPSLPQKEAGKPKGPQTEWVAWYNQWYITQEWHP